ncbi:MAG: hypothetical protein QXZ41_08425 [Ignisphaera sp.]
MIYRNDIAENNAKVHASSIKKEVLCLLKEDEGFRLAVAGFLGLRGFLMSLRGLEKILFIC